jgi:BirA family biotin operon repressor/biotin-[acetyl-CoA-carboxylase] ligase
MLRSGEGRGRRVLRYRIIPRSVKQPTQPVNPLTFPILRLLDHERFCSGEAIAAKLGVSRASVWNALADLDRLGVQVYRVRGRGYRLAEPIDWLDIALLRDRLAGRFVLSLEDVVDSTNSVLLERAAGGAPHRSCVVAELQTRGRGRRGRSWHSPLGGGLTFSLLWRFEQGVGELGGLSLAVGLALQRAMRELGLTDARLKWPNDLLHEFRKLGGILVELQGDALGPAAAVIGIGLNVRLGRARASIDQAVTDLAMALGTEPSRNELLCSLLRHLDEVLTVFAQEGFAPLRGEWEAAHAYHRRRVALHLPSGDVRQGVVVGVAEDGSLRLDTGAGVCRLATGEISLRPAPDGAAARE